MSEEFPGAILAEDDFEPDLITLEDDEGKEHTFEILDAAEIEGAKYLALAPYSEDPALRLTEDADMLLMRIGEDENGEYLDVVTDESELVQVGKMFIDRLSEVYDIDLEELEQQLKEEAGQEDI